MREAYVLYRCLTPVVQTVPAPSRGGGKGNAAYGREQPVVVKRSGRYERVELPVVSGAGVRGPVRDELVRRVLEEVGLGSDGWICIPGEKGYELAETLLKGGRNTAGESATDLGRDDLEKIYADFPFFGLFGSFRVPGRLGVSFALPLVEGLQGWLEPGHPLAEHAVPVEAVTGSRQEAERRVLSYTGVYQRLKGVENKPSQQALDDLIAWCRDLDAGLGEALSRDAEETPEDAQKTSTGRTLAYLKGLPSAQREPLVRALGEKLNVENPTPERVCDRIAGLTRLQNIYSVRNYIPAGTPLLCRLYLAPGPDRNGLMRACFDACVETAASLRVLGGMSARGFGLVAAEARTPDGKPYSEVSEAARFWSWVSAGREAIREGITGWLREKLLDVRAGAKAS